MSNGISFNCDSCGREVYGCNIVNGMKFCAKCYQEIFGNEQKYKERDELLVNSLVEKDKQIAELQKQLKEKDKDFKFYQKLYKIEKEQNDNYRTEKYELNVKELRKLDLSFPEKEWYYKGFDNCERQASSTRAELTIEIKDLKKQLEEKEKYTYTGKEVGEIERKYETQLKEKEKLIEHWHNLYKERDKQFQSVRQRYHLLNKLQSNYNKKDKLHLLEMQCFDLVKENEELKKQLEEKKVDLSLTRNEIDTLKGNLAISLEHKKVIEAQYLEKCKELKSQSAEIVEKIREFCLTDHKFKECEIYLREDNGQTIYSFLDDILKEYQK